MVAGLEVDRLHDLERREARVDPRGLRSGRRLARRDGQARPLPRAGVLARRNAHRLHEDVRRIPSFHGLVIRPRHLRRSGRRRKAGPRRRGRLRAALRQGLGSRLLRQDGGRRRPDRSREARLRLGRARRLGRPRVLPLRARAGVRDLAGREVARVPRRLQRLPRALHRDRPPGRHRPEEQGRASDPRLERRRRESRVLRRLHEALLVLRSAALRAKSQRGLLLSARLARKAARASGRRPEHRLRRVDRRADRNDRSRGRPRRDDEGRRGARGWRRRGRGQSHPGRRPPRLRRDPRRGEDDRRDGQDRPAGADRRPLPRGFRRGRHHAAAELEVRRLARASA